MTAALIDPQIELPLNNLSDRLFQKLREAIIEGLIPPGSKLSEPELARDYGVSRGPLREAISRLEACALVERKPNLGSRVVRLSAEGLVEVYLMREVLEGLAVRLAAERMSDAEIIGLQNLLQQHREQVEQDEGHAYFQQEGDLDFHYRIVQGSRNERLIRILGEDLYYLIRMYRYQLGMASPRALPALQEHAQLLDVISQRDGELAEVLMRHHIRAARRNVENRIQRQASANLPSTTIITEETP